VENSNILLQETTCSQSLQSRGNQLSPSNSKITADLASCYHKLKMRKEAVKWAVQCIEMEDGQDEPRKSNFELMIVLKLEDKSYVEAFEWHQRYVCSYPRILLSKAIIRLMKSAHQSTLVVIAASFVKKIPRDRPSACASAVGPNIRSIRGERKAGHIA
jgi:hypothetical protein